MLIFKGAENVLVFLAVTAKKWFLQSVIFVMFCAGLKVYRTSVVIVGSLITVTCCVCLFLYVGQSST